MFFYDPVVLGDSECYSGAPPDLEREDCGMRNTSASACYRDRVSAGRGGSRHIQIEIGRAGPRSPYRSWAEIEGDARRYAARAQGNRRVEAAGDCRGDDGIAALALIQVTRRWRDRNGEVTSCRRGHSKRHGRGVRDRATGACHRDRVGAGLGG